MTFKEFLKRNNLTKEFTLNVAEEAREIKKHAPSCDSESYPSREDFSELPIFTIDGEDAMDLDDAVHVLKQPDGSFILGVHIADVSHFVQEGSAVDAEAYNRGTSVYFINDCVPMLPEVLCNDLCSLNAECAKLTLSVIMQIDAEGNIKSYRLCEGIIKSKGRMTYTEINKLLNGDIATRYNLFDVAYHFENMRTLALILRDKRIRKGSLDFNIPEPKFTLDKEEVPIKIEKEQTAIANIMIEEFMVQANEVVATYLTESGYPLLYRVHEVPAADKIETLNKTFHNLGIRSRNKGSLNLRLQQALFAKQDDSKRSIVSTIILRSLMKARYSEENHGHFALALKHYCHFTSPIRRYPDLIVHRMVKESMKGRLSEQRLANLNAYMMKAAVDTSECEQNAVEAERDYNDIKLCEFMQDKIGQEFYGIICSITDFGVYVALDNTVEGLIHVNQLDGDYYEYNPERFAMVGVHTGIKYCIGQPIKVRLTKVNVEKGQIDFALAEPPTKQPERRDRHEHKPQHVDKRHKKSAEKAKQFYGRKKTKKHRSK